MADNPFDQFDGVPQQAQNTFDQFDAPKQQMVGDVAFDPQQWGKPSTSTNASDPGLWSRIKQDVGNVWNSPIGNKELNGPAYLGSAALDTAGRMMATPIVAGADTAASVVPDAVHKAMGFDPATGRAKMSEDIKELADAGLMESGRIGPEPVPQPIGSAVEGAANLASKGADKTASGVADVIGGLGTHTGGESIRQAAKAGYQGGDAGQAFIDAMRGKTAPEDVVKKARDAVGQMKMEKNSAYRSGMDDVSQDQSVLGFGKIDSALDETSNIGRYKAKVISPDATDLHQQLSDLVDDWRGSVPGTYHTPEGLDALKKAIGDKVYGSAGAEYGSQAKLVGDKVYKAVRDTITDQAPTYAKTMADYDKAQDQIWQIDKTLSLNPNASVDTALRKLQSTMRNNVNTSFGARKTMADQLNQIDPTIIPTIAGQSMANLTPRGLGALAVPLGASYAAHNPYVLGMLPFQSPRVMGYGAYGLGSAAKYAEPYTPSAKSLGQAGQALFPLSAAQNGLIPNQ